jgi:hypothetical protein
MRTSSSHELRALLRANVDGLTLQEIVAAFPERTESNIRRTLKDLPDSYIDRWESAPRQQYRAVWCVVIPPEDCPHPTKGKTR